MSLQDTPEQKRLLRNRNNVAARRTRKRFPAGTRVVVGKDDASRASAPPAGRGVVLRHVPATTSQGGYLVILFDSGITGRLSPFSVRPETTTKGS